MIPYPKIQSIFKRDERTHKFLEGQYACPEFAYLAGNDWRFTEKIDGTNVRVMWDGQSVTFGGRTDAAQMPTFLLARLQQMFPADLFAGYYPHDPLCLYGEGFGAKIQKGRKYIADGVDFRLFDVRVGEWWLEPHNVRDVADKLGIERVPYAGHGTLEEAVSWIKEGLHSAFGDFPAEGLVLTPTTQLFSRKGARIITKLKGKDFATTPSDEGGQESGEDA